MKEPKRFKHLVFLSKIFLYIAITIHFIFILSLIFGFLNCLFYDSTYRLGQGSDFYAFYQAGHNVLVGLSPYEKINCPRGLNPFMAWVEPLFTDTDLYLLISETVDVAGWRLYRINFK